MKVFDSSVIYNATMDCRFTHDKEKCERRKKAALKEIEEAKLSSGCAIPTSVYSEVRRSVLNEYVGFCHPITLDKKRERFVSTFTNKLISRANKDREFYERCTSEGRDYGERIYKACKGDWRIVAESFLAGEDVELVSFDWDITDSVCARTYLEVAETLAKELGVPIAKSWKVKALR